MIRLENEQAEEVKQYFEAAAEAAELSECAHIRCGAVVVKDGEVIGTGYGGPPLGRTGGETCSADQGYSKGSKHNMDCCIHAEWRAILEACKSHGDKIEGSTIFFINTDEDGNFIDAGDPSCTICSRLAIDAGVGGISLWNGSGVDNYTTDEYNQASYAYHQ